MIATAEAARTTAAPRMRSVCKAASPQQPKEAPEGAFFAPLNNPSLALAFTSVVA